MVCELVECFYGEMLVSITQKKRAVRSQNGILARIEKIMGLYINGQDENGNAYNLIGSYAKKSRCFCEMKKGKKKTQSKYKNKGEILLISVY